MTALHIILIACLFLTDLTGQSLEKQAVIGIRQMLASSLDAKLPQRSFGEWFEKMVGPGNQIVWQLSECGDEVGDACVEANTILKDGRRIILMINVGTFKSGFSGRPFYKYGVLDQRGELRPIKRLSDLQNMLLTSGNTNTRSVNPVSIPNLKISVVSLAARPIPEIPSVESLFTQYVSIEEPPTPPKQFKNPVDTGVSKQPQTIQQVSDEIIDGNILTKVEPVYPPIARLLRAVGVVKVQITISETGRVIEAKAISGHNALRQAAVEAAYKWTFRPTTVGGDPIQVQGTLTFTFTQ